MPDVHIMFGIMMSDLFDSFPLRKARVHEVCGAGASGFAAIAAARAAEDVLWIHETWRPEALNPVGLSAFCDPAKLLVAQVKTQLEALGVAEETLRDGAIPLVVMELSQPLGLTAGRRLQLAAKDGGNRALPDFRGDGQQRGRDPLALRAGFRCRGLDSDGVGNYQEQSRNIRCLACSMG